MYISISNYFIKNHQDTFCRASNSLQKMCHDIFSKISGCRKFNALQKQILIISYKIIGNWDIHKKTV